jgi:FkbM family methyltransferase
MRVVPARLGRKPQYVLHPRRAFDRALYRFQGHEGRTEVTDLPWGLPLEVQMTDSIGYSIVKGGVFDPCVTETLHRLIDPGDAVADVGANVGYMTSLAAARVGGDGRVLAFEPHPRVYELLERNAARWRDAASIRTVELSRIALSDSDGEGTLTAGPFFDANMGLAALSDGQATHAGAESITVRLARLDEIAESGTFGLLKVDVEGHEAAVLRGATRLLECGAIRDIVFEDHDEYPSDATSIVEGAGYELISLDNDLRGLRFVEPQQRGEMPAWPGPSYLATLDIQRARERLRPRGWRVRGIGPSIWPHRSRGRPG